MLNRGNKKRGPGWGPGGRAGGWPALIRSVNGRLAAAAALAFLCGLGLGLLLAPEPPKSRYTAEVPPPPPALPAPRPSAESRPYAIPIPPMPAPAAGPPAAATAAPSRPNRAPEAVDGPAWKRHAVAAPPRAGRAAIAVVIDDLGLDRKRTARVIGLPGPLTLSFLPYAEQLPIQAQEGRRSGHELMLHLPMEAESSRISPGPNALKIGLEPAELLDLLAWNLGRFSGYVGVNNHMGSRFTADAESMRPVLVELERRGLMFLDSRTSARTVGYRLAGELGLPVAQRDIFLDNVLAADRVADQLAELERVARRNGQAIAIGHPHDATIDALAAWLPGLEARGLVLVPVTAIAQVPTAAHARH